MKTSHSEGAL